jgi:hypothetical protein
MAFPPSGASSGFNKRRVLGLVLLLIAGWALLDRYTDFNAQLAVPLLLGIVFTGWSIIAREWGLLVPGGILTGLGAGMLLRGSSDLSRATNSGAFLLCFAGGWLLITLLSATVFKRRVLWPLIPALVLCLLAGAQVAGTGYREGVRLAHEYWPWALLGPAAWLIFAGPRR